MCKHTVICNGICVDVEEGRGEGRVYLRSVALCTDLHMELNFKCDLSTKMFNSHNTTAGFQD